MWPTSHARSGNGTYTRKVGEFSGCQVFIQVVKRIFACRCGQRAGISLLYLASLSLSAHADEAPSRFQLGVGIDLSYVSADGHPSWLEGSAGKLRYDSSNDGFVMSRSFLDYKVRLTDTLNAAFAAETYADNISAPLDLTEAFLEWRPISSGANRYRVKVGAFYPRLSLENTDPGWSSPYTTSSSAINTWVAEELRAYGTEFSVTRRPQSLGGAHTLSLHGAIFYNNDTAGGLIAWKGWSVHDRQSRLGDKIPLPPIPLIQPGNWWDKQDPFITPSLEIDDTYGYYVSAEWRASNRFLVRAMRYDNRTDPFGYEDGQFAWLTAFDHVGIQATLPGDIGLIAQWMDGFTVWGRVRNGVHAVDDEFASHFWLLTRKFADHRISFRYDSFEITENDQVELDQNAEDGHAWTLSYRVQATPNISFAAEWLEIFTRRPAWRYFDLEESNTERQFQLSLRLRFGHH